MSSISPSSLSGACQCPFCRYYPTQEERFGFVTITFWLNREMTSNEIESFVNQKVDDQDVDEYEYDHVLMWNT